MVELKKDFLERLQDIKIESTHSLDSIIDIKYHLDILIKRHAHLIEARHYSDVRIFNTASKLYEESYKEFIELLS